MNIETKRDNFSAPINNSDLIPKYLPDSQVNLDTDGTPEWFSTMIIAEVQISVATAEGTLQSAVKVLDHYQEMGVNGLWITPINETAHHAAGEGYCHFGPHTVSHWLTGTTDPEAGWDVVKDFIDQAHSRNIRIFLDLITHGSPKGGELHTKHPDWYNGKADWGSANYDWGNEEFKEWYIQQIVDMALRTGCDGFRWDSEPIYAGYGVPAEIRRRLLVQGRKIVHIAEGENDRKGGFDTEMASIFHLLTQYKEPNAVQPFLQAYDLVDSIKQGHQIGSGASQRSGLGGCYRFYVYNFENHDFWYSTVQGSRAVIGYQGIFAPFIPAWYIGSEWNNLPGTDLKGRMELCYAKIDWDLLEIPENRAFFEDIKAMIRIRRQYPQIFNYYPPHHRDVNICKVPVTGGGKGAYARFMDDTALLVIPNYGADVKEAQVVVQLPFVDMKLEEYQSFIVSDAKTGEIIVSGSKTAAGCFAVNVLPDDLRILLVKATDKMEKIQ